MESATLLLLASGMGVLFGWQPMPDGSPRYEYVVQLEPELVATLEEGQSIPISSDIPEEIRPIGRIRIVVGREPLPRRQLAASLKPWPEALEKKSREGVLETQYTVPPAETSGSGKYQQILPPDSATSGANVQFAESQQKPAPILPPQETRGIVGSVQEATRELRGVGESVRADAYQLFGTASARQNDTQAILPPGSVPPQKAVVSPSRDEWTEPPVWNSSQSITQGNNPGTTFVKNKRNTTPGQSTPHNHDTFDAPSPLLPRSDNQDQATNQNPSDSFPKQQPAQAAILPSDSSDDWPAAPSFSSGTSGQSPRVAHDTPNSLQSEETKSAETTDLNGLSSAPEIRRDMLDNPAGAEVRTAGGLPAIAASGQAPSQSRRHFSDRQASASDLGWDNTMRTETNNTLVGKETPARSPFPLILSWVLLSGSVVGNVYLFWNFLGVRSKYRGLVHSTRSGGNRYPGS